MNTNNGFIMIGNNCMSISVNNVPYIVSDSHVNWSYVVDAVSEGRYSDVPYLINDEGGAQQWFADGADDSEQYRNITVTATGDVLDKNTGTPLKNDVVDAYAVRLRRDKGSAKPLLRFLDNLLDNPSARAVNELYGFLEYGKLPITDDGHFIAYKRVRSDYKSVYGGEVDNSIGNIVSMPRNQVNDNKDETCSYGLHFCSFDYLSHYSGEKVVVLKINPRDVVSIPTDYHNTKGRACQYEVVGELDNSYGTLQTDVLADGPAVYDSKSAQPTVPDEPWYTVPYWAGNDRAITHGSYAPPTEFEVMCFISNPAAFINGWLGATPPTTMLAWSEAQRAYVPSCPVPATCVNYHEPVIADEPRLVFATIAALTSSNPDIVDKLPAVGNFEQARVIADIVSTMDDVAATMRQWSVFCGDPQDRFDAMFGAQRIIFTASVISTMLHTPMPDLHSLVEGVEQMELDYDGIVALGRMYATPERYNWNPIEWYSHYGSGDGCIIDPR